VECRSIFQLVAGHGTCLETTRQLRAALLAYYRRGTLAMVKLHRALIQLADGLELTDIIA